MYVLSIDTATKSLAVSLVEYNIHLNDDIDNIYKKYKEQKNKILNENIDNESDEYTSLLKQYLLLLTELDDILSKRITVHYLNVIDLIPGKKIIETTIQERTKLLYKYLTEIVDPLIDRYYRPAERGDNEWIFLLENQMGPNTKSNIISAQIIYHLSKYDIDIKLIGPTLKNKIIVGGEESRHSNFLEARKTNYAANKSHSRFCFNKLMEHLNITNMITENNIKKANVDDIADSVLQGLAYVIKYHGFR